jgi:hypothetical protein
VAQAALDSNPGTTGRELDRQAKKRGLSIVYTTINAMAAGTYNSRPSRKTLEALSELSGFSLEEVYAAAKMPLPLKPLRDDLPPDADLLDGTQRRIVIDAIRSFAQQNRRLAELNADLKELMGNAEHPAPKTQGEVIFGDFSTPPTEPELEQKASRKVALPQEELDKVAEIRGDDQIYDDAHGEVYDETEVEDDQSTDNEGQGQA